MWNADLRLATRMTDPIKLIAAVGSVLVTLILGTARIAQLRRLVRKQRD